MSLFDSIKPLLGMCQYIGLAPFLINKITLKWKPSLVFKRFSIMFITFTVLLILSAIIFSNIYITQSQPKMYRVLLIIFMFLNHSHALFVLLEFSIKRDEQINLLNMCEMLNFSMKKNLNMNIDYKRLRSVCRNSVLVWIFDIAALLITDAVICIQRKNVETILYLCFFLPSFLISKLGYVYYVTYVTLVEVNIEVVNKYLKSVSKQNGYYIYCNLNRFGNNHEQKRICHLTENDFCIETRILAFIKQSYSDIWRVATSVNNLIYFSLPIGISHIIFDLIFNSFWFSVCLFNKSQDVAVYFYQMISIIRDLNDILFIIRHCNKACQTVSRIVCTMHN